MAIKKENSVFIYNSNDSESLDIAYQYATIHSLDVSQLIGINCSFNEILPNYSTFKSEVEDNILSGISALNDIWVIVLGYNVPGGFYDNGDVISSTSRISRINHLYEKKVKNPLYDRKDFTFYNESGGSISMPDSEKALIVSRIDGPNKEYVEDILYETSVIYNTAKITGRFYLDPYSDINIDQVEGYTEELLDFSEYKLPLLDLTNCITTYMSPYIDTYHHQLFKDSFYWGLFTDRGSNDFFRLTNSSRVFFYNADYDGAFSIRDQSDNISLWVQLALKNGYISSVGSMSDPGSDGFLRPTPFFDSLSKGASIGEAMIFSSPYLNWTLANFGDPLVWIYFPATYERIKINNLFPEFNEKTLLNEALLEDSARLVAYDNVRLNFKNYVREDVHVCNDLIATVDALVKSHLMYTNNDIYTKEINKYVSNLINYFNEIAVVEYYSNFNIENYDFSTYLSDNNIMISSLIADSLGVSDSSLIYPVGYWEVEHVIKRESENLELYHFQLQISDVEDFSNILFDLDSSVSSGNWFYEKDENIFFPIPLDGVPSNYASRKIKYKSVFYQYMNQNDIYYFRVRQKGDTVYSWNEYKDIIWT